MKNPFFAAFIERKELSESRSSSSSAAGDNSPFYASSQLQSTANRGSGRLDSAFKRKQKTQLAKEKEEAYSDNTNSLLEQRKNAIIKKTQQHITHSTNDLEKARKQTEQT